MLTDRCLTAAGTSQVVQAARLGSPMDIVVLSETWSESQGALQAHDVLGVLLSHLTLRRVPQAGQPRDRSNFFTGLAVFSLLALSKFDVSVLQSEEFTSRIGADWEGIYAWVIHLYRNVVERREHDNETRLGAVDGIFIALQLLAANDAVRVAMLSTPATLEIATRLWVEEDNDLTPRKPVPPGTIVMNHLLKDATQDTLAQTLEAAGGQAEFVAKLALTRLRSAMKHRPPSGRYISAYVMFLLRISPFEPFLHMLLRENVISTVTSALCKVGRISRDTEDLHLIEAMGFGFGYLSNRLHSTEGSTCVKQALSAGLLQALCDCSPKLPLLDTDDRATVMDILKFTLPRYMVYRLMIDCCASAIRKADREPYRTQIAGSIARDAWNELCRVVDERRNVAEQITKSPDHHFACHNVKVSLQYFYTTPVAIIPPTFQCTRMGTKNTIRRCTGCLEATYCSKVTYSCCDVSVSVL